MKKYTVYDDNSKQNIEIEFLFEKEFKEFILEMLDETKFAVNTESSIEEIMQALRADKDCQLYQDAIEITDISEPQLLLIHYEGNWADEIDIEGYYVCTSEEWDEVKSFFNNYDNYVTYRIGTNEEIEYECGKDVLEDFTATKISVDSATTLADLGILSVGFTGPYIEDTDSM